MSIKVINGDCREMLATLPDKSVQCVVTSPPYWGLRDYGTGKWEGGDPDCVHSSTSQVQDSKAPGAITTGVRPGANNQACRHCGATRIDRQIGLEPTPDEFVAEMVAVFREVRRVLRDDGCVFLNLGDSYFGSSQTGGMNSKEGSAKRAARMFSKPAAGAQRAVAYGRPDKAPEGSPDRGCLCGSLCDACRAAYRLGKSHNGRSLAPTPSASMMASTRERRQSACAHPPMSGSPGQRDRSEDAIPDQPPFSHLGDELAHASPVSMPQRSEPRPPDAHSPADSSSACQLCGGSLLDCAPASVRMADCTCDTTVGGLADRKTGTDFSGLAYPDYTRASLKPKDLIGIPWMVAFALRADGWYLRKDIIWAKPNPMPESATDRPTSSHEHVFLLTKSPKYFFDGEAVREEQVSDRPDMAAKGFRTGLAYLQQGPVADNSNKRKVKVPGGWDQGEGAHGTVHRNGRTEATYQDAEVKAGRNIRDVWTIATSPFPEAHFATFPPELAERCIKAGTKPGDTVLDPFAGAFTTAMVADRLQRNAIGIELNPEYCDIARRRLVKDAGMFAELE